MMVMPSVVAARVLAFSVRGGYAVGYNSVDAMLKGTGIVRIEEERWLPSSPILTRIELVRAKEAFEDAIRGEDEVGCSCDRMGTRWYSTAMRLEIHKNVKRLERRYVKPPSNEQEDKAAFPWPGSYRGDRYGIYRDGGREGGRSTSGG